MAFLATLLGTLVIAGVIGYVLAAFIVPEDKDDFDRFL